MRIIGIDCATDPAKTGLVLGSRFESGLVELQKASLGARDRGPAEMIARWLGESPEGCLIAIDAPLGWPAPLGGAIVQHMAGAAFMVSADQMFRRATDRFIKERLGKTPLDVGADRIARTAHAALQLLAQLREATGRTIPLAWEAPDPAELCAIEVYPAATLIALGAPHTTGYKKAGQVKERQAIIDHLQTRMRIGAFAPSLERSGDLLDAAICVLAGADFMSGRVMCPTDLQLAQREGWIWVADRETTVRPSA